MPQNFAGIVNSGSDNCASLAVSGNASVVGSLSAGATTVASLNITGVGIDSASFTANSLAVTNASSFGGAISGTSAVFSGSLQCASEVVVGAVSCANMNASGLISGANGLNIALGAVNFPVASMSGASVINNSLPALAIVNNSVNDAQILPAGISQASVSSGYCDLANAQLLNGIKTFQAIPVFNTGVFNKGPSTLNGPIVGAGTMSLGGLATLNGGLNVSAGVCSFTPAVSFAGAISGTSAVFSGALQCASEVDVGALSCANLNASALISGANGLNIALGAVNFPVASMSGASVINNTLPALAIVNKSISDAQIVLAGVGQTSVASGYVDLVNPQTVAGLKIFSSDIQAQASLTMAGTLSCSGPAGFGGNITCPKIYASAGVIATGGNSSFQLVGCTSLQSTGLISSSAGLSVTAGPCSFTPAVSFAGGISDTSTLNVSGVATFTGGISDTSSLNVSGVSTLNNVVYPVAQSALAIVSGAVAVNLNSYSKNEYSLPMSANITSFTFTNAIVNSEFNIYLINSSGSSKTLNKALSSGTVTCINTLAGNTTVINGGVYLIKGKVISATQVLLQFINAN